MPDVVLIRPGCTDFDDQNRIQGSLDLPLNRRGQEQVEAIVQQLRDVGLDVICSGPCEPARSTAIAISEECGATFKEFDDLRNLDHGLWQGLPVDDIRRKYPKVFKQWHESPETVCLPQGETVDDAQARIRRALRKCLKRKKTVGIVASEPLATLIGCMLRGCRAGLPDSTACTSAPEKLIEFLHVSENADYKPGTGTAAARPPHAAGAVDAIVPPEPIATKPQTGAPNGKGTSAPTADAQHPSAGQGNGNGSSAGDAKPLGRSVHP